MWLGRLHRSLDSIRWCSTNSISAFYVHVFCKNKWLCYILLFFQGRIKFIYKINTAYCYHVPGCDMTDNGKYLPTFGTVYLKYERSASSKTEARWGAVVWDIALKTEGRGFDSRWCYWIFHWHNPPGSIISLGSTQRLTEMNTRNISLGVMAAGAKGWEHYHLRVPTV
jgi:hypothetical protein